MITLKYCQNKKLVKNSCLTYKKKLLEIPIEMLRNRVVGILWVNFVGIVSHAVFLYENLILILMKNLIRITTTNQAKKPENRKFCQIMRKLHNFFFLFQFLVICKSTFHSLLLLKSIKSFFFVFRLFLLSSQLLLCYVM